jgi:hypothetical protein|tara:strand:- start:2468 stop:3835 length:1368 start_codon:yes stop_codon:yes gene_type:complete
MVMGPVGIGFPTGASGTTTISGCDLLVGFSKFINDYWASTTTSAGSGTFNTLVDTSLSRFGDDQIIDFYVRITGTGNLQYDVRRITQFISATGTVFVDPPFSETVATELDYQIHRYDPALKFECLDEARLREDVFEHAFRLIYDDTVTSDGLTDSYDVNPDIRSGPMYIFVEDPQSITPEWNVLSNPVGDTITSWTASNTTATIVSQTNIDRLIPKYDTSCMKLSTAAATTGTLAQTVGSMSITAAQAAGRRMTFGMWVNTRDTSGVRIQLTDDDGDTASSLHGGTGWELLTVEKDISPTNAATLTATLIVAGGTTGATAFFNRAWLYYGESNLIQDVYPFRDAHLLRRDATTQRVKLAWVPIAGRQIRMVGRQYLSTLGTVASTQCTNSMELDEGSAQVLYGAAAETLFEKEGLTTEEFPQIAQRIQIIDRKKTATRSWGYIVPQVPTIRSPYQ